MVNDFGRSHKDTAVFVLAATLGGSTTGLMLVVLGGLVPPLPLNRVVWMAIATVGLLLLLRDCRMLEYRLPENRRQVPQTIYRLPSTVGDFVFGFELGTGVRTFLPASAPYIACLTVVLFAQSIYPGITVGSAFGLSRGVVAVDRMVRRHRGRWDTTLKQLSPRLPLVGFPLVVTFAVWAILSQQP